jgi:hypothetical protein
VAVSARGPEMSWNTAVLPADPGVSTVSLKRPCIEV